MTKAEQKITRAERKDEEGDLMLSISFQKSLKSSSLIISSIAQETENTNTKGENEKADLNSPDDISQSPGNVAKAAVGLGLAISVFLVHILSS